MPSGGLTEPAVTAAPTTPGLSAPEQGGQWPGGLILFRGRCDPWLPAFGGHLASLCVFQPGLGTQPSLSAIRGGP